MQTQYFVYALEVEKTGSITQAAENLYMTQPTLSKAIRDLEASLGFSVFNRSSRGVVPTYKGGEFLRHARRIVAQIEQMELALQAHDTANQMFSLAIPRVSYMARTAAQYIPMMDDGRHMEIDIRETNSVCIIDAVAQGRSVLGLVRYHTEDEEYFMRCMTEKGLRFEHVWQADYMALMPAEHPLAEKPQLSVEDFAEYVEITAGDEEVPYIQTKDADTAGPAPSARRILVYDRAMQFDLLQTIPGAYCWASAQPKEVLEKHGLIQKRCSQAQQFKDVLICRSGYRFSKLDRAFIDLLYIQRNAVAYSY